MKPFYQRGPVTIYCGDCLAVMPDVGSVDAVVTDPPYGVAWDVGNNRRQSRGKFGVRVELGITFSEVQGDDRSFDPNSLLELMVPTALFGANHYADKLPTSGAWFIWDKRIGINSTDQSDCELIWTNVGARARMIRYQFHGGLAMAKENGIRVGNGRPVSFHPTQKPVAVIVQIIEWFPASCNIILDPFAGSGTTGVAAIRTGRQAILIELEEKYCEIAAKRCDRELDQGRLFEPAPPKAIQRELITA